MTREIRTYPRKMQAAVIAEWLAGESSSQLAQKYKVPRSTITTWTNLYPRTDLVREEDLRERFGRLVYETAMATFEALNAHVRAAADPEFARNIEGWTSRVNELTKTAVALGAAIQRGSAEPITVEDDEEAS